MATAADLNGIPRMQEPDKGTDGTGSGLFNLVIGWVSDALTRKLGRRRLGTANSTAPMMIQHGIGAMRGVGSLEVSAAVTYPVPFGDIPAVTMNFIGYRAADVFNPVGLKSDFTLGYMNPLAPSASGFTGRFRRLDGNNANPDADFYYAWTAIGPATSTAA